MNKDVEIIGLIGGVLCGLGVAGFIWLAFFGYYVLGFICWLVCHILAIAIAYKADKLKEARQSARRR